MTWSLQRFLSFAIPGFCYFVSNNCMFLIIRELGPTTFQITNNLKILSTGVLIARVFEPAAVLDAVARVGVVILRFGHLGDF